jgi:endonuclease/exonuclease/phosphatase family metal-dependent hydrolase
MKNLFLTFITGTLLFLISCSNPSDSSNQTTAEESTEEGFSRNIRVMAYNIHHANPPSKPDFIDIDSIVGVIRAQDPDIVALQEVDVNIPRSGSIDQAEEIATKLDMNVFFGKAIDYEGGDYGVAILSKYPFSEEVVHRLPTKEGTNGESRVLATAKVKLPDGTDIRFGSTHLDAQRDSVNRELQINKIVEIASDEKLPFIIAGDFECCTWF